MLLFVFWFADAVGATLVNNQPDIHRGSGFGMQIDEPAAMLMVGSGLVVISGLGRWKIKKSGNIRINAGKIIESLYLHLPWLEV
jgi:hypothetical protein